MKTALRLVTALVVALGCALSGVLALATPASAATPQIFISSGPYTRDQSVAILGTGCPASAPVSLDIWDTAKPSSHVTLDHAADANGSGAFGYSFDLDNRFDGGAQIGFFFSCTATLNWSAGSSLVATPKYEWISVSDPHVDIVAPGTATYGLARRIHVVTDAVLGNATLSLDGTPVTFRVDSHYGDWLYDLPASLGVGTHVLQASWTPQAPGSPTVTDTMSVRITKLTPGLALALSSRSVRLNQYITAKVRLSGTRIAPKTGVVEIKDGGIVIGRFSLRASDAGIRSVRVRLTRLHTRNITATFLGNTRLNPKRSAVITVVVRR